MQKYTVIIGSPCEAQTIHSPFKNFEKANEWARNNSNLRAFTVVPIEQVEEVFENLSEFFADPDKLVKSKYNLAEDENGKAVGCDDPAAVRWCIIGGAYKIKKINMAFKITQETRMLCTDLTGRPHSEIMEVFKKCGV